MTSGNTTPGRRQPSETTSGNTRTGRPRRTPDLPEDLAAELTAFTTRLASATDLRAATPEKYRRNTAAFLTWLAQTAFCCAEHSSRMISRVVKLFGMEYRDLTLLTVVPPKACRGEAPPAQTAR